MSAMRFFALLCLALSIAVPNSSFAKKSDAVKKDLGEVHKKIESLKKDLKQSKAKQKDAADDLKASEVAISKAKKKLYDIKKQQRKNTKTLQKLNRQSKSISEKLATQQQQLSKLIYQQYKHGNKSYTQLILEQEDPNVIARDIQYYSYIAKAHSELINDMQNNLSKIEQVNQETTKKLAEVEALKKKQETEKKSLEKQKKAKAKVVKSLSKKISKQRNQISKLKRDEKALSSLFKRLNKPKKTTKKKKPSKEKTVANNTKLPSNKYAGIRFSKLKGKLRLPVRGKVANRFGSSRADTGLKWKGLFIRANEGKPVKSVAEGKVVFADWMRGFGNLLIIDHGQGYMSLYGNNQALLKNTGEVVKGGETIATVGNTGGNKTNGLYYELRRNSKPFNPMRWSKVR